MAEKTKKRHTVLKVIGIIFLLLTAALAVKLIVDGNASIKVSSLTVLA